MSDTAARRTAAVVIIASVAFGACLALLAALQLVWAALHSRSFSMGGALAVAALACVLLATATARLQPVPDSPPTWIGATGILIGAGLMAATTLVVRSSSAATSSKAELAVLGLTVLLAIASLPAGRWLTRDDRLRRAIDVAVDRTGPWEPRTAEAWTIIDGAVLVGLGLVLIAGIAYVLPTGPFGHDESIYALKARSWIEGTPSTGFEIYRPIGMPIVGWVVLQFSDTEVAFRSASVLLSVATLGVMWWMGRCMFDRSTATIGVITFAATASFLRRAPEFLNDVPAAGFLLGAILAIWYGLERSPRSWWMLAAAPAAAGAFYMRYGSLVALGVIALIAAAVWWRAIAAAWSRVLATAGLFIVLLVPHFVYASDLTGDPFGVVRSASTSVGGGGGGLADYASWLPRTLAGRYGALLMVIAVIYAVGAAVASHRRRGAWRPEARTTSYLALVAIATTLVLGAFTHGEPRFVFMPLMLVVLAGSRGLVHVVSALRRPLRVSALGVLGVVVLGTFVVGAVRMEPSLEGITQRRTVLVDAAAVINADTAGRDCEIRTSYQPQLTWYTECASYLFKEPVPSGPNAYLVVFENGKRQPTGDALAAEREAAGGTPIATVDDPYDRIGDGEIFRYP